ncbi:MAG: NAD(P)-dependent oxidoreductase [Desulfuromonadales bacterium]|uniref:NAD(P)-dependent oxidoreductase n=1 Tax=Desulfuromonas sp. KJ2020 TaxID=2919173 RepID=UPI0020A80528|nr:NAD(P)-dependent oxidoreductase [Desulfuromonas sp. KJ2020]MCP3177203.1 NAD(P)-dependent oxidoreductase [Desulfuromonas sp. KJ2020]
MIKEVGFVGLGTVGKHMAINLLKGNYNLTVFDNNADAVNELEKRGAKGASSAMEAAKGKDLVIVILPEKEEWEAALSAETGFLKGIDPGTILVDMGTHSLETTMELAEEAASRRVMFLEAPVWGTKEHAANGLLTILTGGDPTLLGRCREPFSFFALNVIHVGEIGSATRMKFVVNLVQAQLVEGLAEGLVFGEKLGFSADRILEVLDSGGVASPLLHSKGRSIARGDFSRNLALKYVFEGLQIVKDVADKANLELPANDAVLKVYEQAVKDGRGEEDFSAVIKVLRR